MKPTAAEAPGEFETPQSDCYRPLSPASWWDVLQGLLLPGERVQAIENVAGDRVAVRVHDGKRGRTIWLRKYGDGGLEEGSPPP